MEPFLVADRIANLTAARYFAAREARWLFFDPSETPGMTVPAILAIREWVEGPRIGLSLPLGKDDASFGLLRDLRPDGVLLGPFAPGDGMPEGLTIFREWRPEPGAEASLLAAAMQDTPAERHLLRLGDWDYSTIRTLLDGLGARQDLILEARLVTGEWAALRSSFPDLGWCFRAPDEEQTGILSFEALDTALDELGE